MFWVELLQNSLIEMQPNHLICDSMKWEYVCEHNQQRTQCRSRLCYIGIKYSKNCINGTIIVQWHHFGEVASGFCRLLIEFSSIVHIVYKLVGRILKRFFLISLRMRCGKYKNSPVHSTNIQCIWAVVIIMDINSIFNWSFMTEQYPWNINQSA